MCHLWLISLCKKNCIKYQILIGIIPTFFDDFIRIYQVKAKASTKAILRIYTGLDHFIIGSLQNWILEAAFDRLEIQSWLKGEIVPNWISSLSMAAFKIHFNVNDKMV